LYLKYWDMRLPDFCFPKGARLWFLATYVYDWIIVAVVGGIGFSLSLFVSPFDRYLPLNDPSVSYPLLPDIVPVWLLLLLCWLIPVGFFLIAQYWRKSFHDLHHGVLCLFAAFMITGAITSCVKVYTGRYRPDWDNYDTADGRQSFPSGHSSTAFSMMTILSLYWCGKTKIFSNEHSGSMAKLLVAFLPQSLAIFIACSRTRDYHHNFSDILAGSLLGAAVAVMVYFCYYPSLFHPDCDRPKLIRPMGSYDARVQDEPKTYDSMGSNLV